MSDSSTETHDSNETGVRAAEKRDGPGVNVQEYGKYASTLVMFLGIWLLLVTIFESQDTEMMWGNFVVGFALFLVGTFNRSRRESMRIGRLSYASLVSLLGLWLLLTPTVVGTGSTGTSMLYWSHLLVGGLSLVLGSYSAYGVYQNREEQRSE